MVTANTCIRLHALDNLSMHIAHSYVDALNACAPVLDSNESFSNVFPIEKLTVLTIEIRLTPSRCTSAFTSGKVPEVPLKETNLE